MSAGEGHITPGQIYLGISLLAHHCGIQIKDLRGLWCRAVDEDWAIWVNASGETTTLVQGLRIPPHSAFVTRRGEPIGYVNINRGLMVAGADVAFNAALEKAITLAAANSKARTA